MGEKNKFVRIPTIEPLEWWEKLGYWLTSIILGLAVLGCAYLLKTHVLVWSARYIAAMVCAGSLSIVAAINLWIDYDRFGEHPAQVNALLGLLVSMAFYGLTCWFGLEGWTSRIILFSVSVVFSGLVFVADWREWRPYRHAVANLVIWAVWLVPFFLTRQHWWKYVGYGAAGLGGLILLVLILVGILWFASTNAGKAVGHALHAVFVRFPKLIYTVFIGHPRYWHFDNCSDFMISDGRLDAGEYQKPYVYLPMGGLFRKAKVAWPGNHWRIKRKRLGFGGFQLVDRFGVAVDIWHCKPVRGRFNFDSDHYSCPWRKATMLQVGFRTNHETGQGDWLLAQDVLRERSVGEVYEVRRSRDISAKDEFQRKIDRLTDERAKEELKRRSQDAERRLELAKQLAGIAALVKAAPRNKKLGTARHQLTRIITGLAGSEEKAKALLLDALEALEQSESHSN